VPHVACFESPHAAREACRIVNFCGGGTGVWTADWKLEGLLTTIVTSHELLAAAGWREYAMDRCVPVGGEGAGPSVVATLPCRSLAVPSFQAVARMLERMRRK
jgi:hypothetical protein